jgi:hypothetical protein
MSKITIPCASQLAHLRSMFIFYENTDLISEVKIQLLKYLQNKPQNCFGKYVNKSEV